MKRLARWLWLMPLMLVLMAAMGADLERRHYSSVPAPSQMQWTAAREAMGVVLGIEDPASGVDFVVISNAIALPYRDYCDNVLEPARIAGTAYAREALTDQSIPQAERWAVFWERWNALREQLNDIVIAYDELGTARFQPWAFAPLWRGYRHLPDTSDPSRIIDTRTGRTWAETGQTWNNKYPW